MRSSAAAVALVLVAWAADATAYTRPRIDDEGPVQQSHWPDGVTIPFIVNIDPPNSILAGSQPFEAVRNAFEIRSMRADIRFSLALGSFPENLGNDGTNLVTFKDTPQNRSVTAGFGAVTHYRYTYNGGEYVVVESDIAFNPDPSASHSTNGTGQNDIEGLCSHELTHVLMLDHLGIQAVTAYPDRSPVRFARSLEMDDIAGTEFLYPFDDTPSRTGAMSGTVLESGVTPIFGANVVAVRQGDGNVVGDVSVYGGEWRIDAMPPGDYVVYAEPFDGPIFPSLFTGLIYTANPFDTVFRTTYAGGNATPTVFHVTAGSEVSGITIAPPATTPGLNIRFTGISPSATSPFFDQFAVEATQGTSIHLTVAGAGMGGVPDDGVSVTGPGVQVASSDVTRGTFAGTPYMIVSVTVAADAPPVPRSILARSATEVAAVSGGFEVLAAVPAPGLLRSDAVTSLDPVTPPLATVFPLDATGPDAFPGTGEGTLREFPGSDDDDDLYVPEVESGFLDPDVDVATDTSRPLVFYRLTDPNAVLHVDRTAAGRVRISY